VPQVTARQQRELQRRSFFSAFLPFTDGTRPRFIFRRSHPTLITPRDFDLSPYFEIVKFNVIEPSRFDYSKIIWAEDEEEGVLAHRSTGKDAPSGRLYDR
jgi:hypothetical protein